MTTRQPRSADPYWPHSDPPYQHPLKSQEMNWWIELTRTLLQWHSVSLAWWLDWEIRRLLILHETDLLAKGFFLLTLSTLILFTCFWIDLVYMLVITGNMLSQTIRMYEYTKIQGLDSREITSLPEIKKVIYMAHYFNYRRKLTACSSQDPFAYNESLQHPTIAVLLIKILIFFDHSVVFTCSKVINTLKQQNSWTNTFQKSSKFNLS